MPTLSIEANGHPFGSVGSALHVLYMPEDYHAPTDALAFLTASDACAKLQRLQVAQAAWWSVRAANLPDGSCAQGKAEWIEYLDACSSVYCEDCRQFDVLLGAPLQPRAYDIPAAAEGGYDVVVGNPWGEARDFAEESWDTSKTWSDSCGMEPVEASAGMEFFELSAGAVVIDSVSADGGVRGSMDINIDDDIGNGTDVVGQAYGAFDLSYCEVSIPSSP
jgi:hypothetical protein